MKLKFNDNCLLNDHCFNDGRLYDDCPHELEKKSVFE